MDQQQEQEKQQAAETLLNGFLNGNMATENGMGEREQQEDGGTASSLESAQEAFIRQLMAPLQQQQQKEEVNTN